MSESNLYVAVQDFSLNLDNGAKNLSVKAGDFMAFDGLYVECRGERGQACSLSKVVGEWIVPKTVSKASVKAAPLTAPGKGPASSEDKAISTGCAPFDVNAAVPLNTLAHKAGSNATGGRLIESSDLSVDLGARQSQENSNQELRRLLNEYEDSKPESSLEGDIILPDPTQDEKSSKIIIEDHDAQEVAKVSAKDSTATKNTSGVEIAKQTAKKAAVISQEERVAKKTQYSKKVEDPNEYKKIKVDKEAGGIEVRKVKSPAIHTNSIKSSTAESRATVSNEDVVVSETSYGENEPVVVGSTTQTKIVQDVTMSKTATKPATSDSKRPVMSVDSQDGMVVRKVSKIPEERVSTQDGITSKVTVGASGDMELGDVSFGSNSDISDGEVTFSAGEDTVVDLGGKIDDGEIDINGILDGV